MAATISAIASRTIGRLSSSSYSFVPHPQPSSFLLNKRPIASTVSHAFREVISSPPSLSTHRLTPIRCLFGVPVHLPGSNSAANWTPPQKVGNYGALVAENNRALRNSTVPPCGDKKHWFVSICFKGNGFPTEQALFDYYIRCLAAVVGSEAEAKKRIYLVSCSRPFGFGAEFDENTKKKLEAMFCSGVDQDVFYGVRNEDPSDVQFTPMNWNHRLDNIFSYHYLSKWNSEWNSDHWLIHIKEPAGGFVDSHSHPVSFCIDLLAEFVGSEEARQNIYIIWLYMPYGFAAQISEETLIKLKGLPDVLKVLPDYSFDQKNEHIEALLVSPPSYGSRFNYHCVTTKYNFEVSGCSMEDHAGVQDMSVAGFTQINRNYRLDDIYRYHHLSECNSEWNSDHWVIHVNQLDGEFGTEQQTFDFCVRMLAEIVGSEEAAKEKIYIVWCKLPFGFGAEIDEETSNKLKCLPNVLTVLPDYAFDVKNNDSGVLVISSSSCLNSDPSYANIRLSDLSFDDPEPLAYEDSDESELDFKDSDSQDSTDSTEEYCCLA